MPQFVESGVWTARILLQDSLNVATLLPATLQGLGFPTDPDRHLDSRAPIAPVVSVPERQPLSRGCIVRRPPTDRDPSSD